MELPSSIGLAFVFTILAGLSTGIGGAIAFFIKKPKTSYIAFSLGFSGGVMVYTSFMELLPNGMNQLGKVWGITAFFLGIIFIAGIDMLIPKAKNPHHFKEPSEVSNGCVDKTLMRIGLFTALAIGIHNFPEGLATFGTALSDLKLGAIIALAIAIHNIPEGISVSVPIYCATGNKKKAFVYSFLTGVAEPIGAVIGFLILMPFLSPSILAALLAFAAGIMVFISVDELLPMAHQYGHSHVAMIGIILGMLVMAMSLLML